MSDNPSRNALVMQTGTVDSLSANEFAVEIDGERAAGIFKVGGFISFQLDVKPTQIKAERPPFTISRMVQRDPALPFNRWIQETVHAKDDIVRPKRTVTLLALDDGVEIRRWTITGAWISAIHYSDFDSASGELVQEIVTVQYESISETWMKANP